MPFAERQIKVMEKRGTIVYIGGFEMPDKNAAAHMVLNNSKLLFELGYDVVFCGIDKELLWTETNKSWKINLFDNCPRPYPKNSVEWILDLFDFKRIKSTLDKYDDIEFVFSYNMHAFQLYKLQRYCKKHKIKIVSNITEWMENKFSLHPRKFAMWVDTMLEMRVLQKKVDAMVSVSSFLDDYYSETVKYRAVVPPLIDVKDSMWLSENEKAYAVRPEFIYSGGIEKGNKKDKLNPIICAFENLKDRCFHFSIVGITKGQLLSEFPELGSKLETLGDKITFYGRVPHEESISLLKNADYTIFIREPSRKNMAGFPTKFVEGWTSGVNIISSNISDIENYFPDDGRSILLINNKQETINKAIADAIDMYESKGASKREGLINNPFDYRNWKKTFKDILHYLE